MNPEVDHGPNLSGSSIAHYFLTRVPSLRPPPFQEKKHLLNPFPHLAKITRKQWSFIGVAFFGWTWDAFDFFSVSLTVPNLAATLEFSDPHKSIESKTTSITWGITLVLMLRSVGAVIFGLSGDKWGRKWPFIANCLMFIALEIGCGFVKTYKEFLAVRALFGIAMGGMVGNAAATALEDCPPEARGFISGLLQQGYAFGYLLVVIFSRALVDTTSHQWRPLYWFGGAVPVLIIAWRLLLPETDAFIARQADQRGNLANSFMQQAKKGIKTHWLVFCYLILFMTGMNFMSHGSQDLYPTRLTNQLGYSKDASTVTNSVANLGALFGGVMWGHFSQFLGRRLAVMICCVIGGALVYPWGFSTSNGGVNASVFFFQAMVQGAWGVVPTYLSELSPEALRSFVVGTTYQLGNLVSSAASTIEARIRERYPLHDAAGHPLLTSKGQQIFDYGKVMGILMGAVFAYTFVVTFLGPEGRPIERHVDNFSETFESKTADIDHHEGYYMENEAPTKQTV